MYLPPLVHLHCPHHLTGKKCRASLDPHELHPPFQSPDLGPNSMGGRIKNGSNPGRLCIQQFRSGCCPCDQSHGGTNSPREIGCRGIQKVLVRQLEPRVSNERVSHRTWAPEHVKTTYHCFIASLIKTQGPASLLNCTSRRLLN